MSFLRNDWFTRWIGIVLILYGFLYCAPPSGSCVTDQDCVPPLLLCRNGTCIAAPEEKKPSESINQQNQDKQATSEQPHEEPQRNHNVEQNTDTSQVGTRETSSSDTPEETDIEKADPEHSARSETSEESDEPSQNEEPDEPEEPEDGGDTPKLGCQSGQQKPCYGGASGSAGKGLCREGLQVCTNGHWGACIGEIVPQPEICDGKDNDCNGLIDENFPSLGKSCEQGKGECLRRGKYVCTNDTQVACDAVVGQPSHEICDGKDNDCNGLIDDLVSRPCYDGPVGTKGIGACQEGIQRCHLGTWDSCQQQVLPTKEICDGKDNDCNGQIDEGLLQPCQGTGLGVCRQGTRTCINGVWGTCQTSQPTSEICDGLDNDCNGSVDELAPRSCYSGAAITAGTGLCRSGTQSCIQGKWSLCWGEITPQQEVCDKQDNDCNGQIDENCGLPPDPAQLAPSVDSTVATNFVEATKFLYAGKNPVQSAVAVGVFDSTRISVLRGKVLSTQGTPLSGVIVRIQGHPEYGTTLSRTDGMFDLVVNGGTSLVVEYEKEGYPTIHRHIGSFWRNYVNIDDVVLTPYDTKVSTIDLSLSTAVQVARSSIVADGTGTRQATLFFKKGTTATLFFSGGSNQAITKLSVRATEYTVGLMGPAAMPAPVPLGSAYTYAVELSVDEAIRAKATEVRFSQPVIQYLENYRKFPVGAEIPVFHYERTQATWLPSPSGVVIKVLGISNGSAVLDVTGSGQAASPQELQNWGIDTAELSQLAVLYQTGETLWRVPLTSFSPKDYNLWVRSRERPNLLGLRSPNPSEKNPGCQKGSMIQCHNQFLGKTQSLVGTPFSLHYQSHRQMGYHFSRSLTIPLLGTTIPSGLREIRLEIDVAGRRFSSTYPAKANQSHTFVWDGKDAYGRFLQGRHPVEIRMAYVYEVPYQFRCFAQPGYVCVIGSSTPATVQIPFWTSQRVFLGSWNAKQSSQLGGWSIDAHHAYDPTSRTLYEGNGRIRSADTLAPMITVFAGDRQNKGSPANQLQLISPSGLAVDGQGQLLIATSNSLLRIEKTGTPKNIALPNVRNPGAGVAVDAQNNIYTIDTDKAQVLRVDPKGTVSVFAGNGQFGYSGDGGPAIQAKLHNPEDVAVDGQGNVYIACYGDHRIRMVRPNGIITTIAGTGQSGFGGDGGLSKDAMLFSPSGVAVDTQGNVYVADSLNHRIRKIDTRGIISTIAGTGSRASGVSGNGGPAIQAALNSPRSIAVDLWGQIYFSEYGNHVARKIDANGYISTVAGNGIGVYTGTLYPLPGNNGPATQSSLYYPKAVTVDSQGILYVVDGNTRVYRIAPPLPGYTAQEFLLPSREGSELFHFAHDGRHLRTLHALTGAVLYRFLYDNNGLLTGIVDVNGNTTTIARNPQNSTDITITAPFGQKTLAKMNRDGLLVSLTNEAAETTQFTYDTDGLLTSHTNPRGYTKRYTYDKLGLLVQAENTVGGSSTLARTQDAQNNGYTVKFTSPEGRVTSYQVANPFQGGQKRADTTPDNLTTNIEYSQDDKEIAIYPDGTKVSSTPGPDPRFGMQVPLDKEIHLELPNRPKVTFTTKHTVELNDPLDLLSLLKLTTETTMFGRTYQSVYDATNRTISRKTPLGKTDSVKIDGQGRIIESNSPGVESVFYSYDKYGRMEKVTYGAGTSAVSYTSQYNSQGWLKSITDPLGQMVSLTYDAVGRLQEQRLPDSSKISLSYDKNGNLLSLTTPGNQIHAFVYDAEDRATRYTPPTVGGKTQSVLYAYNKEGQLAEQTLASGAKISLSYDKAGRFETASIPRGSFKYRYRTTDGKLEQITAPDGSSLQYNYTNTLLDKITWKGTIQGSVELSYDSELRLTSRSINGTYKIDFTYNNDSELTKAGTLSITRDLQNGRITGTILGDMATKRSFNNIGTLSDEQVSYKNAPRYGIKLLYDKLSRIVSKTETIGSTVTIWGYQYDLVGRLVSVEKDGKPYASYKYDANGNRLEATESGSLAKGTYDAQDRLLQYGTNTYTYGDDGDLQSKTEGNKLTRYKYDTLGNLLQVELSDGTKIEYLLDAANRRIGKKINGKLVAGWLYKDGLKPIAEIDGNGNIVARFVYADRLNVPSYMDKGGRIYRFVCDQLGSVRLIIDTTSGNVVQRIDYDVWGRVLQDTNPGFQPFGFAGGLYDTLTGLVRFGARDYDAAVGRWISKDPSGLAGGLNLYEYAGHDPVNLVDMNGMHPLLAFVAFQLGRYALRRIIQKSTIFLARRLVIRALAASIQPIPKSIPAGADKPCDYDEEKGYRYFFHGTTLASAIDIMTSGVKPVSRPTPVYPKGYFFTFEANDPMAFVAASHMATWDQKGGPYAVILGKLPSTVFDTLYSQGLVKNDEPPRGLPYFPNETVFFPDSFPEINIHMKWIGIYHPAP